VSKIITILALCNKFNSPKPFIHHCPKPGINHPVFNSSNKHQYEYGPIVDC
jgi:hypothetical protein